MARWPNAKFSDGTIWDNDNYWAKGTIDDDENAYSNGTILMPLILILLDS